MPGYSGTPLAKKLGIREDSTVGFIGEPPLNLECAPTGGAAPPFVVVLAFVRMEAELAASISVWASTFHAGRRAVDLLAEEGRSPSGGVCIAGHDRGRGAPHGLPLRLVDNR